MLEQRIHIIHSIAAAIRRESWIHVSPDVDKNESNRNEPESRAACEAIRKQARSGADGSGDADSVSDGCRIVRHDTGSDIGG